MNQNLSTRQFKVPGEELERRLRKDGGFTVHERSGRTPRKGFAVSIYGQEQTVSGVPSASDINEYRTAHAAELAKPNRYVGGWHDVKRASTDLDVTERRLTDVTGARAFGREHAQRAVYDLNRRKTENIHYGPGIPNQRQLDLSRSEHREAISQKNELGRKATESLILADRAGSREERRSHALQAMRSAIQQQSLVEGLQQRSRRSDRYR